MNRWMYPLLAIVLVLATAVPALAQDGQARIRVVHASPDAPAVDVLVNGQVAFQNVAFSEITDYAGLDAGTYSVQVVPTGATEPVVIDPLRRQVFRINALSRPDDKEGGISGIWRVNHFPVTDYPLFITDLSSLQNQDLRS